MHTSYDIIQPISASMFTICFILRTVHIYKPKSTSVDLLKIAYIMESIAFGLIGLGLLMFGTLIILTMRILRLRSRRIPLGLKQILKVCYLFTV